MRVGDKVTLKDDSVVEIVEVASEFVFIAKFANGKTGILYVSQVK